MTILPGNQQTHGWQDEFAGNTLHLRWEWRVPAAGPAYQLKQDQFLLSVPARTEGYNHWSNFADAPMLTTSPPQGDWDFEGVLRLVETDPAGEFHVGLTVGFTPRTVLIWGPYQSRRFARAPGPQVWLERTGEGRMAVAPMPKGDLHLKIEKRGASYQFLLKESVGSEWKQVTRISSLMPPQFIGITGKTFAQGESKPLQLAVERLSLTPVQSTDSPQIWTIDLNVERDTPLVSPMIYGHFIEHLGRCIQGGIWAEILNNRKFAGNVQSNGVVEGWESVGEADFSAEHERVYTGGQAQKIELKGTEAGIVQAGLDLQTGKEYNVRVVFQGDRLNKLKVELNDFQVTRTEFQTGWQLWETTLKPTQAGSGSKLKILAKGPGTLIIGCVSLMPTDNLNGFRRDVIDTVRSCNPPIVRWPGGNFVSGYDWKEGIGERDKRPPRWDRAWGAWEMNDVGTDEFIQFCRLLNTEPYICVNAGEGTPRMAAEWVEYCNGSPDTPMGKLRAENGHPEPYKVRYWGTGNEMYGDWQLGHLDPVKYGLKAVEFARAMRTVDPDIKLILVGVEQDGWGDWNRKALRIAGKHHDYLSVHFYQGADHRADPLETYHRVVMSPVQVERSLARTAEIIREVMPDNPLPIAFDEWNTWYANAVVQNGLEQEPPLCDGLFSAGIFHAMIRLCDRVQMANLAQLVNVLGALRASPTQLLKTPTYLAFEMYAPYFTGYRQSVTMPDGIGELVDIVAVLSEKGDRLAIGFINRSLNETQTVRVNLRNFAPASQVTLMRIEAARFDAINTFSNPDAVQLRKESVPWRTDWVLPAHSVSVLLLGKR